MRKQRADLPSAWVTSPHTDKVGQDQLMGTWVGLLADRAELLNIIRTVASLDDAINLDVGGPGWRDKLWRSVGPCFASSGIRRARTP